jgi:hypothetical protein
VNLSNRSYDFMTYIERIVSNVHGRWMRYSYRLLPTLRRTGRRPDRQQQRQPQYVRDALRKVVLGAVVQETSAWATPLIRESESGEEALPPPSTRQPLRDAWAYLLRVVTRLSSEFDIDGRSGGCPHERATHSINRVIQQKLKNTQCGCLCVVVVGAGVDVDVGDVDVDVVVVVGVARCVTVVCAVAVTGPTVGLITRESMIQLSVVTALLVRCMPESVDVNAHFAECCTRSTSR